MRGAGTGTCASPTISASGREIYDKFTFVAPSDPRLPGGGGQTFTAFDLRAGAPAQNLLVTFADKLGKMTEHFDGVNVTVNARMENGLLVQGGFGTGRQITTTAKS